MFFILSKVLHFLITPFYWILILSIIYYFTKSAIVKKKIKIAIIFIAIIFSNPFIYDTLVKKWQPIPTKLDSTKHYSVGILLGGFAMFDRYDQGYFGNNADRFIQAANLYHSDNIKKILMTGGTGRLFQKEPSEASFALKELIRNGVRKEDIIFEDRSRNTIENAIFSRSLLDSMNEQQPYVLITSALHMPRSLKVFQKAGYQNIVSYPCDYKVIDTKFSLEDIIVPDIKLLNDWQYFLHEIIGTIVYQLTGKA
jgi:uncharacterized SAM-binding protein YcdF (DUF218 family)